MEPLCSYYQCEEDVAAYDPDARGFQFCSAHDAEVISLAKAGDAKGLLRFWVKAQGGVARAASRAMGDIGENNPRPTD